MPNDKKTSTMLSRMYQMLSGTSKKRTPEEDEEERKKREAFEKSRERMKKMMGK